MPASALWVVAAPLSALMVWYAFDHYWLRRRTGLPTAPDTLSCSGCRQRDRRIRWWQFAWLVTLVAGIAGMIWARTF